MKYTLEFKKIRKYCVHNKLHSGDGWETTKCCYRAHSDDYHYKCEEDNDCPVIKRR